MRKIKRILSIISALCLLLTLCSCGKKLLRSEEELVKYVSENQGIDFKLTGIIKNEGQTLAWLTYGEQAFPLTLQNIGDDKWEVPAEGTLRYMYCYDAGACYQYFKNGYERGYAIHIENESIVAFNITGQGGGRFEVTEYPYNYYFTLQGEGNYEIFFIDSEGNVTDGDGSIIQA